MAVKKKQKSNCKLTGLHGWYLSKGWKADALPSVYKAIKGSEISGAFVVETHPGLFIPIRSDTGRVLDYGFVPGDTWVGEIYEAPVTVLSKTHPWYKKIKLDIIEKC